MGSKKKWLWVGISAAAVVIIAVACVLVFVVFQDEIFDGATGPEKTVEGFMKAMSDKDVEAYVALISPEDLAAIKTMNGLDDKGVRDAMKEDWTYDSMKFSGIKMKTELAEDGKSATVTIIAGKVTTITAGQEEVTDFASELNEFPVVLIDGKWYLPGM